MISPELIRVVVVDSLGHSADDVVPIVLVAVGVGEDDGSAQEELEVDEVSQLIAGNKGVGVTGPASSSNSTNTVNKQLGPETLMNIFRLSITKIFKLRYFGNYERDEKTKMALTIQKRLEIK